MRHAARLSLLGRSHPRVVNRRDHAGRQRWRARRGLRGVRRRLTLKALPQSLRQHPSCGLQPRPTYSLGRMAIPLLFPIFRHDPPDGLCGGGRDPDPPRQVLLVDHVAPDQPSARHQHRRAALDTRGYPAERRAHSPRLPHAFSRAAHPDHVSPTMTPTKTRLHYSLVPRVAWYAHTRHRTARRRVHGHRPHLLRYVLRAVSRARVRRLQGVRALLPVVARVVRLATQTPCRHHLHLPPSPPRL